MDEKSLCVFDEGGNIIAEYEASAIVGFGLINATTKISVVLDGQFFTIGFYCKDHAREEFDRLRKEWRDYKGLE